MGKGLWPLYQTLNTHAINNLQDGCFSAAGSNSHFNQNWFWSLFLNLHVVREHLTMWALRLLHGNGHSSQTPKLWDAINHWQSFSFTLWCSSTHQRLTSWRQLQRENQKLKATKHPGYYVHWYFQMCKQTSQSKKLKDPLKHLNT